MGYGHGLTLKIWYWKVRSACRSCASKSLETGERDKWLWRSRSCVLDQTRKKEEGRRKGGRQRKERKKHIPAQLGAVQLSSCLFYVNSKQQRWTLGALLLSHGGGSGEEAPDFSGVRKVAYSQRWCQAWPGHFRVCRSEQLPKFEFLLGLWSSYRFFFVLRAMWSVSRSEVPTRS